jgi:hypothetical protein
MEDTIQFKHGSMAVSAEQMEDKFSDHAPCFLETVPAKICANLGILYSEPWFDWPDAGCPKRNAGGGTIC